MSLAKSKPPLPELDPPQAKVPSTSEKPGFVRRVLRSFRYAFAGLGFLWRTQPNFRVHLLATAVVVGAGLYLRIERRDWALLALAIGFVLAAEGVNTALELMLDAVCPEHHPLVGRAKDVAAAAVLLAAMTAVALALLVFPPYLF